jgi:hypothetical protein
MIAMAKQQKIVIDLPNDYTLQELSAIGQDFIDHIIKRTSKGLGEDSKSWKGQAAKYSEAYKKSLNFKIGGKSKSGPVNLELSGDMLSMLEVLNVKRGRKTQLVIGYEAGDSELNGKVEGNRIGSYGGSPKPSKARDFLAIGEKDKNDVLKNYPIDDKQERRERAKLINRLVKEGKTYQQQALEEDE